MPRPADGPGFLVDGAEQPAAFQVIHKFSPAAGFNHRIDALSLALARFSGKQGDNAQGVGAVGVQAGQIRVLFQGVLHHAEVMGF